ncbi:MAG: hypothetical protein DIZ80_10505 [endosymbiont of Galathealinum brachiosum]|uniref:Uncharacterized protein n=1 Tax=endosymbiont of Galathealinum brachiosum TaxID=2200906 RepID=A0A370DCQ8_9GAMM|nr:MAG: hypothetical protein DIZ80_10505 [endosymbiont of Galathealinum brachiosum]
MKIIFLTIFVLFTQPTTADEKLTLNKLVENKYHLMTSNEISEILIDKTVILKDLLSEAVYEISINKEGKIDKKIIKEKTPKMLTNIEYHSRADMLSGSIKFSIGGNKIISTDGVRTYMSSLYKKGNKIFGVRDIDHDIVNFEIISKKE